MMSGDSTKKVTTAQNRELVEEQSPVTSKRDKDFKQSRVCIQFEFSFELRNQLNEIHESNLFSPWRSISLYVDLLKLLYFQKLTNIKAMTLERYRLIRMTSFVRAVTIIVLSQIVQIKERTCQIVSKSYRCPG